VASTFDIWGAIRGVKSRIGKWRAFETWRALDPAITRDQWQSAWSQATAAVAARVGEVTRPLNRRPVPGPEIHTRPAQRGARFTQFVTVFVRDAQTGDISEAPFAVRTDTLRSRMTVIAEALDRFSAATDEGGTFEGQEIINGQYAGTIQWGE
jgi:hypothetical protein